MAKSGVKEIDRGAKRIMQELRKMSKMHVTVGVHEGAGEYPNGTPIGLVAATQEFGTAKAGRNKNITIPERSFFRSTLKEGKSKINSTIKDLYSNILVGRDTTETALKKIGLTLVPMIKGKILKLQSPGLAPSTVSSKKSKGFGSPSNPLVATRLLWRSINYEVIKK